MIFVAGGGVYGAKAISSLRSRGFILAVDVDRYCRAREYVECIVDNVDKVLGTGCSSVLVVGDATKIFTYLLKRGIIPEIVVPAIPKHFAGEVFRLFLELEGYTVKPYASDIDKALEILRRHGVEVKADHITGVVVASYMPFTLRCKPGCREPPVCPVTKKAKALDLHRLLHIAFSGVVDDVFVLESRLLDEEVGGFSGHDLFNILNNFTTKPSYRGSIAIATACTCHGVANTFYCLRG